MASATVREAFRTRLAAVLPSGWVYVETVNGTARTDTGTKFITLEFAAGFERQISIGSPGSNLHRETGTVLVHLFKPAAGGNSDLESAADTVRTGFRGYRSGTVRVFGVAPADTGPGADDGGWFRATVPIEYEFNTYA